jgi:hypothetical protein
MAGFQLTLYGRFWVTPEDLSNRNWTANNRNIRRLESHLLRHPQVGNSGFQKLSVLVFLSRSDNR